jgi:hypothetical protein
VRETERTRKARGITAMVALMGRIISQDCWPDVSGPVSFKRRRNAQTARHDLVWAQLAGSGACRPLLTTLVCHPASGRSQPRRTIFRRIGVVAKTPCNRILAIRIAIALSRSTSAAWQESTMNGSRRVAVAYGLKFRAATAGPARRTETLQGSEAHRSGPRQGTDAGRGKSRP